jgi:hypothetical protein
VRWWTSEPNDDYFLDGPVFGFPEPSPRGGGYWIYTGAGLEWANSANAACVKDGLSQLRAGQPGDAFVHISGSYHGQFQLLDLSPDSLGYLDRSGYGFAPWALVNRVHDQDTVIRAPSGCSLGDINGDGVGELLVWAVPLMVPGNWYPDEPYTGAVYLLNGAKLLEYQSTNPPSDFSGAVVASWSPQAFGECAFAVACVPSSELPGSTEAYAVVWRPCGVGLCYDLRRLI